MEECGKLANQAKQALSNLYYYSKYMDLECGKTGIFTFQTIMMFINISSFYCYVDRTGNKLEGRSPEFSISTFQVRICNMGDYVSTSLKLDIGLGNP